MRDNKVAKELKTLEDSIESEALTISMYQNKYELLDKNGLFYKMYRLVRFIIVLTLLELVVLFLGHGVADSVTLIFGTIIFYTGLKLLNRLVIKPIRKSILRNNIVTAQQKLNSLSNTFETLIEKRLLPEIHQLALVTANDVINKTSAFELSIETIIEVLDNQVSQKKMEKVQLYEKADYLYKSLLNLVNSDVVERVTLEIE